MNVVLAVLVAKMEPLTMSGGVLPSVSISDATVAVSAVVVHPARAQPAHGAVQPGLRTGHLRQGRYRREVGRYR